MEAPVLVKISRFTVAYHHSRQVMPGTLLSSVFAFQRRPALSGSSAHELFDEAIGW